jgi:hypothetical protein
MLGVTIVMSGVMSRTTVTMAENTGYDTVDNNDDRALEHLLAVWTS